MIPAGSSIAERPSYERRRHLSTCDTCDLPMPAGMGYASSMSSKDELYDRATDLFGDGKTEEAIAVYREALALDSDFADAWHGLGMALSELGRHDEAIEAGKRLCELSPDDTLAHTTLSRFYQAAGRIPEAEAEGAKARILDWKHQLAEDKGK
jgi:tetratricopeptide (TPR) repeat protein